MDLSMLALPALTPQRESVVGALTSLATDPEAASRILRLTVSQRPEIEVNRALRTSPTLPAMDRYTGVLYDALDAASLDGSARRWLGRHAMIHSAPFGPVAASDRIPAYRLGAAATLPGIPGLRRVWADAVTAALVHTSASFMLDLRSEAYVALGPVPASVPSAYLRIVASGPDGVRRALNHFNKAGKGSLVRRLATTRPRIGSRRAFQRWADAEGLDIRPNAAGELDWAI